MAGARMKELARVMLGSTLIFFGLPLPAYAQDAIPTNPRMFSGLFGGAAADDRAVQAVDFTGAVYGGYDDNVLGNRFSTTAPQLAGTYGGAQASLGYRRRFARGTFGAQASGAGRYLTDSREFLTTSVGAGVQVSRLLSPRTTLGLMQSVRYRPFFSVLPFSGGSSIGPSIDTGDVTDLNPEIEIPEGGTPDDFTLASNREAIMYQGGAVLSHSLSNASTLTFGGGYGTASFRDSDLEGFGNVRWQVFGRYSRRLTEYASLRLGYGYRKLRADGTDRDGNHNIDVGIDYGRPFTFGRGRTTFSVTTGSAILVREQVDGDGGSRDRLLLRALGRATLRHDFVGPWQAQLSYVRSVQFIDGINEPFLGDRVTASIGGLIGQRTDLLFSAGYVSGSFGVSRRNFNTATGNVRLRVALTRQLAFFGQYYYYQYLFDDTFADQLFLPPTTERQGVRGGLTVWLPLLR